jgi:hypothetical protein
VLFALTVLLPFNPEIKAFNDRMQARIDARKQVVSEVAEATAGNVDAAVKEAGEQIKADEAKAAAEAKEQLRVDAKTATAAALATGKVVSQNRTQKRASAARKTAVSARR